MVRDLAGAVTRENADLGVLISFTKPTKPMEKEAADAGFHASPMGGKHPKIQILTIELLRRERVLVIVVISFKARACWSHVASQRTMPRRRTTS
jgi:hypothetical protein